MISALLGVVVTGACAQEAGHYEVVDLGTLGGPSSSAWGINASGQVTGESTTESGTVAAFVWTEEGGMVSASAAPQDVNPSGQRSSAWAVNNANDLVGRYELDEARIAAFLRPGNGNTVLGPAGSELFDISDPDENHGALAVGFWPDLNTGSPAVAIYDVDRSTVLITAIPGSGRGINQSGTIVGCSGDTPFFCRASDNYAAPVIIPPLPGFTTGQLFAINDQEVAVGQNTAADGTVVGVVYGAGTLYNVNALLDPVSGAGWVITALRDINNDGWMVGTGTRKGEQHGVLLHPVDQDGDGLNYYSERFVYGTDPLVADSDGDGVNDGKEAALETNPLLPAYGGDVPVTIGQVVRAALPLLPDSITVTSPNGGETLIRGASFRLTWLSTGNVGSKVKITARKGTLNYVLIASTANDSSFVWPVPTSYPLGPGMSIEISSVLNPTIVDSSDATFSIANPPPAGTISVTVPSGGESYFPGQTVPIAWVSNGVTASSVQILARSSGQTYVVATSTQNDGRFDWTMPRAQTPGNDYVIEVLPLTTQPTIGTITVTAPNGGESYLQGVSAPIRWSAAGETGSTVQIVAHGGGQDFTLAASTTNNGAFNWPVSLSQLPATNYRIEVRSLSYPAVGDSSNADFTIQRRPPITVVSPNGGETLVRGTTATITWTSTSEAGTTVKIVARKGNYGSVLAGGTPNDGSYSWKIPVSYPTGPGVTIEISSLETPNYVDASDGAFSIAP